jgi:hypothetical protein
MTNDDLSDKTETSMVPEVANRGIMRPPLVYLGAIALGLLLHFAWTIRLVSPAVSVPLGSTVVLVAVALFLYAVRTLLTAGTPVRGNRSTTTIVCTGTLSIQPQSHLLVFLAAPVRHRMLGQQSLATRHPHASGGADVVCSHPARGALPGEPLPVGLLALQGFCASLAVSSSPTIPLHRNESSYR